MTCHALGTAMVRRALDVGVDELCHVATEPLDDRLVERLAEAGTPVVSTLHTMEVSCLGPATLANARALVAAGVPLLHGTDLGNAGTRPGVDPLELELLAAAGLSGESAWWAATEGASRAAGLTGMVSGTLAVGTRPAVVLLHGDPRRDPAVARQPVVIAAAGRAVSTGGGLRP